MNGSALTDVVVQNFTCTCDLLRYQMRRTITFAPPAEHPAVQELLRWYSEELRRLASEDQGPPSFGPIS